MIGNWRDISSKLASTPVSRPNFQTILDLLHKVHHKNEPTHWETIEEGVNAAVKILKYITPNGPANAQKIQELWSKVPVQKIAFSNEIVIEDASDVKGKLVLHGLAPGFDVKKVCDSFSDSFGADVTSSQKRGDNALEIRVSSDEAFQLALKEAVFHSGGNEIKITAGGESPFIIISGINELKNSEIAEKIQDRWNVVAKSESIKFVGEDAIIELPDEESVGKCAESFMYKAKKLPVSKGGAVVYFRKEVQDASKVNSFWEDHFGFKITEKVHLSSNKLTAIIPLSASEMTTIFSSDSPHMQIGGEKIPVLRFSLHRLKITFPAIITPDDVKSALAKHINTSEILDADFMNGTAFIHLKSVASKKTLLSISPISVTINNKSDNNNSKNSNESKAPSTKKSASNSNKNKNSDSKKMPNEDKTSTQESEEVIDYDGKTLKAIVLDNIPPKSKPGFVIHLLEDIVQGRFYVTLRDSKAYVEFLHDEDFQKVSSLSKISETTLQLVTGPVPHFTVFLSPVPPSISSAQIFSAFEKAVVGSHPRVIGVSEVRVPSEKILSHAVNVVRSMKIGETEIQFSTKPGDFPKVNVSKEKLSVSVSKLHLKYVQKYQSKELKEIENTNNVKLEISEVKEHKPKKQYPKRERESNTNNQKSNNNNQNKNENQTQKKDKPKKYQDKESPKKPRENNNNNSNYKQNKEPKDFSNEKKEKKSPSHNVTVIINGNSKEEIETAKEQLLDLISDLALQSKQFRIPKLEYSNFVVRYLSSLISETEEPLVFPPNPRVGSDKFGPFIALLFVGKADSIEESLGTIAIQIEELTTEDVDLPGRLQELKVDGSELEKKFTVHITETPKGISIFGSSGAIDDVKNFLGEKIGVKSMRLEVQPAFSIGEYKLFKEALLSEYASKLKKELEVDLKAHQEKKTFTLSGSYANLEKAKEEIKQARSLITTLEFSKPIHKNLIRTLDRYLKSKLKNLRTEFQIFSRYSKKKKTNANLKLRKNASDSDSEDSESEDESENSQTDKMSSVTSGSLDEETADETKKYEKLVQIKIWYLKDDKDKVSKKLESLGSFSDERLFDPSAANILRTYKKDLAITKHFTFIFIRGRKVWFNSLEEQGMFDAIENVSKYVEERNKIKKKINVDPLKFHFLKNQQQKKASLEDQYSVDIIFENRDVFIRGSPSKVNQAEEDLKELLKSLTRPSPKNFSSQEVSKRDLFAIKQPLEEKYQVSMKIKENQDKTFTVEAIGFSDTNWKEFDDEFLQFSSESWKPEKLSDYDLLNNLFFKDPKFDRSKFEEEWNIKKIYFQNSSKTITLTGRPEDIKSAKEALQGKIINKQFTQHTLPVEIYTTSLLLNKLVPYGAQIEEIEKKYKVKCTIKSREKDIKVKGPKEFVGPAVAEVSRLLAEMNASLKSEIVEVQFVLANELTKNNFKLCEEVCRETGVYINFPDWKKTQIHFTLTSTTKNFKVQIVNGDILHETGDCIVNAANEELQHNGGIAADISKKAGEALIKECKDIIATRHRIPTGQAVRTTAGNLPFKAVIHTVGPIWKDGTQNEETLLKNAINAALQEASIAKFKSISIPVISSGIFKFPKETACKILIDTILSYLNNNATSLELVRVCDKDAVTLAFMEAQMHRIKSEVKTLDVASTSTNTAMPFEPPVIAYQWSWRENDGSYVPFDPDQNNQIELAWFKQGQKGIFLVTGDLNMQKNNHKYEINFDNMTELNTSYRQNPRPIKRTPKAVDQYTWEVETPNGRQKLSTQDCGQLELALKSGFPKCEVAWLTGRGFVTFGSKYFLSPKGNPTDKFPVYRVGYEERMRNYLNPPKKVSDNNSTEKEMNIPEEKKTRIQLIGLPNHIINGSNLLKKKLDALLTSATLVKFGNIPPSAMFQLKLICAKHSVRMEERGPKGDTQIVLTGLESSIASAKNDIYEYAQSFADKSDVKYPSYWESSTKDLEIKQLSRDSKEWHDIETRVKQTLPSAQISKIERIQNKWHWDSYYVAKKMLDKKNNGNANEMQLFHGTRNTPPSEIYTCEKGFDLRFANSGMWGIAVYFAVNASYSNGYAFSSGSEKQFFLARVLVGDYIVLPSDGSIRKPPKKGKVNSSGIAEDYDSVSGNTGGSQVFMIYEHNRCYPEYLITYKV